MTTPPDDPRADEGLLEAMARAIHGGLGGNGWACSNYSDDEWDDEMTRDMLDEAARADLAAACSHGGGI